MKKGFTLIELLAVIALLAVLLVFIVPNSLKTLTESKNKLSGIQKKEITEAVELYINDYCINPISDSYECTLITDYDSNGLVLVKGEISLENFASLDYIDSTSIKNNCKGKIEINDNKVNLAKITCDFK